MGCNEVQEALWQHQSQELSPSQRQELEDHLQSCSACAKEQEALAIVLKNLPKPPELSSDYWSRYNRKILNSIEQPRPPFLWRWAPALALSFLLVGGGAGIYYSQKNPAGGPDAEIVDKIEILDNLDILEREDFDIALERTHDQG